MIDKNSILQILGSLMKHPQFLSETDKYMLTPVDFRTKFDKYLFIAIEGLYKNGATSISPIDIDNYFDTNESAKITFEKNNGIEYLQDAEYVSDVSNFPYYYKRLKKFNLLDDLKKQGIETSQFYNENLTDPNAVDINQNFEKLEISDILGEIKKRVLQVESTFLRNDVSESQTAYSGMADLLEDLGNGADIGKPIQGTILNEVVAGARKGAFYIRSGSSGVSKALPNSTRIPTPCGWTTVGQVKVGDYLFDAFGKPTKVIGVFPQGSKEVYEVTFKDGRKAKCCKEHLWSFNTASQKKQSKKNRRFYTEELQDIMKRPLKKEDGQYNILVPMNKAVQYEEKDFYLSPYVFGLLLGDGSFRQNESNKSLQFSSETDELPKAIANETGWILKNTSNHNFTWYFGLKEKQENQYDKINVWVEDALKEYPELIGTYSNNKYIPEKYLQGSVQQRIDLLNGLLDSDGSIDERGRVSIATTSELMRDNIIELVQSLGMKGTFTITASGRKLPLFSIHIICSKKQKKMLFRLQRKIDKRNQYINNERREEINTHNPIVNIEPLNYNEEMTCFRVDNDEHLFLINDYIVTHNTRQAVGDACYLAYPFRYDDTVDSWVQEGYNEKVLVIATEQDFKEIRKMILAYLTGMNESKFRYGQFSNKEKLIIKQALWVMKEYEDNFIIVRMPNPTIELVKNIVRENCLTKNIEYVFYDYIFISPSLLSEFKGVALRNDEILLMFSTALKELAVELGIFVMTSTQVNANADDNKNIRNEGSIAGSRAIINKADVGMIMARPTKEEIDILKDIIAINGLIPNIVTDIYKVRSGQYNQVRIWSSVDLGNLRKKDLFMTDSRLDVVNYDMSPTVENWEDEEKLTLQSKLKELSEVT